MSYIDASACEWRCTGLDNHLSTKQYSQMHHIIIVKYKYINAMALITNLMLSTSGVS